MNSICLYNGTVITGFAAMEHCAVLIENGLVSDVFSQKRFEQKHFSSQIKVVDVGGRYISPGFIDTHIHGFAGFGTEDAFESPKKGHDAVLEMSRNLCQYGLGSFNPTLYPAEKGLMLQSVKAICEAIGKEEGAKIMGLHLEGPFLSPKRLGVQKADTVMAVDLTFMEQLWEASGGKIVNMTVAPELKGMRELALFCIKKGIILQAGHTEAEYENMVEGMQAGILHCTHMFNAMKRMDHRNPNAVGAILIHPEMSCEIIPDGFHVHPDLYKLLLRNKPVNKIVMVTDSLRVTEQKEGPFLANCEEMFLDGGLFRRKSDNVIAGSSLTMIRGIKNLVSFGFNLEDAVKTASFNPAQVMRYSHKGAIVPGHDADLTVFDSDFNISMVLVGGRIVQDRIS